METIKQQLEVNAENINKAFEKIKNYAAQKNFDITGNLTFSKFTSEFPSLRAKKKLKNSLNRIINHPTMRSVNLFLHHLSKVSDCTAKLEYSAKEKSIIDKRNKWKESRTIAEKLMKEYKDEKKDFYKQS